MIGRLNHIAIAVPDLAKASELYRIVMGAKVSAPKAQPAHGVTVVFVELPNTKIELLHPLGEKSPIANFLARKPIITSIVAAVLWIAFYFLHRSDIFSFRQMAE